ncbi:hypothetical protein ENUP19_0203G0009 [Entamoeba nuttalli]|uniref:Uncharacterized protein n=1 Tax=Entamoeba nuttalli TaxID=412467 RepID=A0ABQ0DNM3_9EUKA
MFFFCLLFVSSFSLQQDDIILLPRSSDGTIKYEISSEQMTSSDGFVGHFCTTGNIPSSLLFPKEIEEIGLLMKRVTDKVYQYSSIREFMSEYNSNTYMVIGNAEENIMKEIIYNFTGYDVVRFGKVNTNIYNPITNIFYGINNQLEHPNGFFYTSHSLSSDYKDQFPISGIFEIHQHVETNNSFSELKNIIENHLEEMKKTWNFDSTGDRFYMRVNVNLKNKTFEYCEIDTFETSSFKSNYPKKTDKYNRNIYFLNSCGIDYYNKNSTCKFTRFSEKGKNSEMFDFDTVQYTHPIPVYLQRLKGEGTHLTTEITTLNFNTTNNNDIYLIYTVPQGIFIDKYQMQELQRKQKDLEVFMYEPMDLEAPILTGRQAHVIIKTLKQTKSISTHSIPIHLRYHKARINDMFEKNVIFPPPEVFFICDNCTDSRSIELLKYHNINGYFNTPISCGTSDPSQFISPTCNPQFSQYTVPVGQLDAFDSVMKITLGTTLIGAIIIIAFVIIF